MNTDQRLEIKRALDILLRRKKMIFTFILIFIIIGIGFYLKMPKIYKSTSLIKYQRQSVNPTKMSPDDIQTSTKDVVENIKQQIMSRSSLEDIINEFHLYTELQSTHLMEDIVDNMREHDIEVQLTKQGDIIDVSYQGEHQATVVKVTNALAAKFIEENLRYRQDRATQTSTYIRDELKMAKDALDKKEVIMRDYKLKYYNEMPSQLDNNMKRLASLQEQYQNIQTASHELERTKIMAQEQISLRKEQIVTSGSTGANNNKLILTGIDELHDARAKLIALQTRYTDNHPEIKRLKKIISDLEQKYQPDDNEKTSPNSNKDKGSNLQQYQPQLQGLTSQINEIENNLARLEEEREDIAKQIKQYEEWIAATPIREAEWSALTRDYEQLNHHYENLVTESLQAESAQSLETQLKGSQFVIVDPAFFPEKPFSPDFKKIISMSIGVGLALSLSISFVLEFINTSFKDPNELEKYLNITVVCAIPNIQTKHEIMKEKLINTVFNLTLFVILIVIIGSTIFFWQKGLIII